MIPPFYRWRNFGSERWRHLCRVSWLGNRRELGFKPLSLWRGWLGWGLPGRLRAWARALPPVVIYGSPGVCPEGVPTRWLWLACWRWVSPTCPSTRTGSVTWRRHRAPTRSSSGRWRSRWWTWPTTPASCSRERGSQAVGWAGSACRGRAVGGLASSVALALPWWTGCAGTKRTPGSGTWSGTCRSSSRRRRRKGRGGSRPQPASCLSRGLTPLGTPGIRKVGSMGGRRGREGRWEGPGTLGSLGSGGSSLPEKNPRPLQWKHRIRTTGLDRWAGPGRVFLRYPSLVLIVLPTLCRPRPPQWGGGVPARCHSPHLLGAAEGDHRAPAQAAPASSWTPRVSPSPHMSRSHPIPPSTSRHRILGPSTTGSVRMRPC